MKNNIQSIKHPIPPLFDENSKVLILGSFPSVKSRETRFFYGHPQNRFWKILSSVLDKPLPFTIDQKREFLLDARIAVWDVISTCEIAGSADSSIKNVVANDISVILENADIKAIFVNGKTALKYYKCYIEPVVNIDAICLPSSSPANAAWSFDKLVDKWRCIKEYLE